MVTYVSQTNKIFTGPKKGRLLEIPVTSYFYPFIQYRTNMYTHNIYNLYCIIEPNTYEDFLYDYNLRPYNLISGSPVLVPYGYLTGQTVEYQNRNLEILRTEVFFTGTLT